MKVGLVVVKHYHLNCAYQSERSLYEFKEIFIFPTGYHGKKRNIIQLLNQIYYNPERKLI